MKYVIIALLLGGCAMTMEQAHSTCEGYGHAPGSGEMTTCVQTEMRADKDRRLIQQRTFMENRPDFKPVYRQNPNVFCVGCPINRRVIR